MLYKYCEVKKNIYKWRDNNKDDYNEYLKNYMREFREYKRSFEYDRICKTFRNILIK